MPAIQLVHMYVADQIIVPLDKGHMRLDLVNRIVTVEHGADRGMMDLAYERGGLVERSDHIALAG